MTNTTTNTNGNGINIFMAEIKATAVAVGNEIASVAQKIWEEIYPHSEDQMWSSQQLVLADYQDTYTFDLEKVNVDRLLEIHNVCAEQLPGLLLQAGLTSKEVGMLLAEVYERCFLISLGDIGPHMGLWAPIRFNGLVERYAASAAYLYWGEGRFTVKFLPTSSKGGW